MEVPINWRHCRNPAPPPPDGAQRPSHRRAAARKAAGPRPRRAGDAELLALLLRTGIVGKGVLQLAQELLEPPTQDHPSRGGFGGIAGLLHASAADLKRIKGLGPAKRAELVAVLELARRALAEQLREREVFDSPHAVKHYLQLHLASARGTRCLPCCSSTARTA
jgi:DNA repair protein RadC